MKRVGERVRIESEAVDRLTAVAPDELIAIDDAIDALARDDPQASELVKLRYFAGFSIEQSAELIGISRSTAYEHWSYARAWLKCQMQDTDRSSRD